MGHVENHHEKYIRRFRGLYDDSRPFLPWGDNSHNAAAKQCFEPRQRICISVYECSGHLRDMADCIVLGLVLFLLMLLKSESCA